MRTSLHASRMLASVMRPRPRSFFRASLRPALDAFKHFATQGLPRRPKRPRLERRGAKWWIIEIVAPGCNGSIGTGWQPGRVSLCACQLRFVSPTYIPAVKRNTITTFP